MTPARPRAAWPGRAATFALLAASLAAVVAHPAAAQTATPLVPDECYGFAFGRWTPALDAAAAGHRPARTADVAQAPGGRDWASAVATGRDTTLILFPVWWPAGVALRFPAGTRTATDTVRGTATAFVANGRVAKPRAAVLAWRVACAARAPDRESGLLRPTSPPPSGDGAPDPVPAAAATAAARPRPAARSHRPPPRAAPAAASAATGR